MEKRQEGVVLTESESERLNVFLKWVNLNISWRWESWPVLFLRTEPSVPSSDVHLVHLLYRLHSVIMWVVQCGLYYSQPSTRLYPGHLFIFLNFNLYETLNKFWNFYYLVLISNNFISTRNLIMINSIALKLFVNRFQSSN